MAKTTVALRNIAQKFGFVEQARSASTPEDHSQVVDRVEAELTDAKMRLADLEHRRETVVLEGGDIRPGDAIRAELPAVPHRPLQVV